jgi:hypothetical protein
MRSMMKFWTTFACLSVLGCAEGSPSQPVSQIEPPLEMAPPSCGNGKVDKEMGEECDCGDMVSTFCQVMDMDCNAVGRGNGALLCNARPACTFNYTMCANSTPAANGGSGAMMMMPGGMRPGGGTGGTGR